MALKLLHHMNLYNLWLCLYCNTPTMFVCAWCWIWYV